ncbi:YceI family protein [Candidatus Phycosocius spiralis]|uniref:Polyisoprenoid-binding protein n=1 Tax=Candidatus Phycosocius spiralis TaxID=2815099 RepID=A0ABQ4PY05_9PROT|nr:YceI family protein [Candidatus Phycosocius spiralis]GIU67846.1 polyisoprenoid-binding protein [Candidatus Phycosocius spiralis]
MSHWIARLALVSWISITPFSLCNAQTAPAKKASKLAPAQAWTLDASHSQIGFSTTWAGKAIKGSFGQWSGDIRFDPANLAGSSAVITIMTGSAKTGVKEPDDNLPGADWFDTRTFPTAHYTTSSIRALGQNRYNSEGLLTIKGVNYRVAFPFNVKISGSVATMTGQVTLDRIALRLGLESDRNAEWVARPTVVTISVRAIKK